MSSADSATPEESQTFSPDHTHETSKHDKNNPRPETDIDKIFRYKRRSRLRSAMIIIGAITAGVGGIAFLESHRPKRMEKICSTFEKGEMPPVGNLSGRYLDFDESTRLSELRTVCRDLGYNTPIEKIKRSIRLALENGNPLPRSLIKEAVEIRERH